MISFVFLILVNIVLGEKECYWNAQCPFQLYSTKTPYDTVRGDIRDHANPENCEALSVWSLHRHGNRNPGSSVTEAIKNIALLKDEIVASYDQGRSQLCSQDIDEFRKFVWNETLETSQSFLTSIGYEEIYDVATRIRQKYPHLLQGSEDDYYFRTTNEQRTITSSIAFVHGLTEGTNLTLDVDGPWERDDVIRPYQNCAKYQEEVKGGETLVQELEDYGKTDEYIIVQKNVQDRLGITTQLSADDIYTLYEICRFYRSWSTVKQSPWCSVFSDEDLVVLEYRDDVRHYHRNGYGSWVNVNLGEPVLKDLYENFQSAINGQGKYVVSYFTHDTMMEMAFCALGLYKDSATIRGSTRNTSRLWRTSYIAAFSTNIIAVLNRCSESGTQTHRIQIFINEKESELCPFSGCTWQQFENQFQNFTDSLDFCSLDYTPPETKGSTVTSVAVPLLIMQLFAIHYISW